MTPFQENEMRMFDQEFGEYEQDYSIWSKTAYRGIKHFLLSHNQRFIEDLMIRLPKEKEHPTQYAWNECLSEMKAILEELK